MSFEDRSDAGRRLTEALSGYQGQDVIVLALPRGGVPVAAEVAAALHAPLGLVLVRKIGAPGEPELALGAIADAGSAVSVRNEDIIAALNVSDDEFDRLRRAQLEEIRRRRATFLNGRPPLPIRGRIAIVVDDGVATGATAEAALRAVRDQGPAKLVMATPVASAQARARLSKDADELVCLEDLRFSGVGAAYSDFRQVSDRDVVLTLSRFAAETPHDRRESQPTLPARRSARTNG